MSHREKNMEQFALFPLANRNNVKQIQIFLNEWLSCLIHSELYKTRATIIYAYIDIYFLFLIKSFASKFKDDLFPGQSFQRNNK